MAAVSYPRNWPPAVRTAANRIATFSSPKVRFATRPPSAASRYADWRRKPATRSRQYNRAVARIEVPILLPRPANPERISADLPPPMDADSPRGRAGNSRPGLIGIGQKRDYRVNKCMLSPDMTAVAQRGLICE